MLTELTLRWQRRVRILPKVLPVLFACMACACTSVAPGMHFDAGSVNSSDAVLTGDHKPVMKAITPELVRQEREQSARQTMLDISQLVNGPAPYHIAGGDILSIVVWDHPELAGAVMVPPLGNGVEAPVGATPTAGFVVAADGTIQFPFAGGLKVAGLTEAQARTQLTARLAHYINKPDVTLRVQSYRSKRVYVDGEIKTPGLQPITDIPMTLYEALNRAGGVLPSADQSQIAIIREGKTYVINLQQLSQHGDSPSSIMLSNGDVVRVLSRDDNKVFVSGEVQQPRSMVMHNGSLTLNEAIGEAGGINPQTGDGRQVYVIRNAGAEQPLVFHLDTRSPAGLSLAEQFPLRAKDVVYVDAAPLATWHRVISLIFPSALTQVVQADNSRPGH